MRGTGSKLRIRGALPICPVGHHVRFLFNHWLLTFFAEMSVIALVQHIQGEPKAVPQRTVLISASGPSGYVVGGLAVA